VTYFQCPACGVSFKVASERSGRIFCSRYCRAILREAVSTHSERTA